VVHLAAMTQHIVVDGIDRRHVALEIERLHGEAVDQRHVARRPREGQDREAGQDIGAQVA
jgi:hypothetical protein